MDAELMARQIARRKEIEETIQNIDNFFEFLEDREMYDALGLLEETRDLLKKINLGR